MKYGTFVDLLYDDWEFRAANHYNSTNLPPIHCFHKIGILLFKKCNYSAIQKITGKFFDFFESFADKFCYPLNSYYKIIKNYK